MVRWSRLFGGGRQKPEAQRRRELSAHMEELELLSRKNPAKALSQAARQAAMQVRCIVA